MKIKQALMIWKAAFSFLFTCTLLFVSCTYTTPVSRNEEVSLQEVVDDFASLECRAIHLREQRFALANQIRFTQDTLMHTAQQNDTARLQAKLQALNIERERTTGQSLALADSIKHTLDSLQSHFLKKEEDKTKFNQLLHTALDSMQCNESSSAVKQ